VRWRASGSERASGTLQAQEFLLELASALALALASASESALESELESALIPLSQLA